MFACAGSVMVRHRRRQELLEDRQRQTTGVGHRRLESAFRLLAECGPVDRQADRLAHRKLVGRELGQVRFEAVGLDRREPDLVVGVAGHEHLLHTRDEVARPMQLIGLEGRQGGVGRRVGRELHLGHRRLAAPVAGVGLQRDPLRAELGDGVGAGADRVRVGVLARDRRPCSRPMPGRCTSGPRCSAGWRTAGRRS